MIPQFICVNSTSLIKLCDTPIATVCVNQWKCELRAQGSLLYTNWCEKNKIMKLLIIPQKLVKLFDFISFYTLNGVKEMLYGMTGNSKTI